MKEAVKAQKVKMAAIATGRDAKALDEDARPPEPPSPPRERRGTPT